MNTHNEQDKILAIAPYTVREKDGSVMIGDLFITKINLYFVPLQPFEYASSSDGSRLFGTILGGLVGGINGAMMGSVLTSSSKSETLNDEELTRIENQVENNRESQYGLSPQERVKQSTWKDWAVTIPNESVVEIEGLTGGILICHTIKNRQYTFLIHEGVPNRSQIVKAIKLYSAQGSDFYIRFEGEGPNETSIKQTFEEQGFQVIDGGNEWILKNGDIQYSIPKKENETKNYHVAEIFPMPDFGISNICKTLT